ncbi:hypothetical protein EP1X_03855 [Thermococcus sp. EP1]|uniref:hypothetical protein n=1 Tax=Thermococcus sp. EP1 TaxID=1591054 RepID=UPI0006DAE3D4|nr:hypothetical protein [Thermococcus sp. EP1]KPU63482.1 hypothetical protein EP1X_03855 [Thermococcus sp. EP1]
MKENIKVFLFLLFATPLWTLIAFGIEKLESIYGKISPEILFFIYPTLIVALITALFLWKLRVSLPEFSIMVGFAPLIVAVTLSILSTITDLHSNSYHSDDPAFFIFFLFYLFPVASFLLGMVIYYGIRHIIGERS